MSVCNFMEESPFYCATHECGSDENGALHLCMKPGCPHCGEKKVAPKVNVPLMLKKLGLAQRKLEEWTAKNARACSKVLEYHAEVRRLWKRLEDAGVNVDPMEVADALERGED